MAMQWPINEEWCLYYIYEVFLALTKKYTHTYSMFPLFILYDYKMGKRKQDIGKGGGPSVKVGKSLGQGSRVTSQSIYSRRQYKVSVPLKKKRCPTAYQCF